MSDLESLDAELLAHRATMAAYQMLCHALIATHPDRPRLLAFFMESAQAADAHVDSMDRLSTRKEAFRVAFDGAYGQIVQTLQTP